MGIYSFYLGMNKRMQQAGIAGTCCVAFMALILAGFSSPSFGAETGFKIFKVEVEPLSINSKETEPVKDFFINGGEEDGVRQSMVLDVFREKSVRSADGADDYTIRVPIGQIKVAKLYKDIAVTRMISIASPDNGPVLEYRTIMIGDYAVPRKKEKKKKKAKNPEVISGIQKALPGEEVIIPSQVLFKLNGSKLKPEAMETLSIIFDKYNKSKDKDILVSGHTCDLGTDEFNFDLSKRRAQSVKDYFIKAKGISTDRVYIEYHGEKIPIASNESEEGRAKNRRVEIRFLPHGSYTFKPIKSL